jgi:hypothetical protein
MDKDLIRGLSEKEVEIEHLKTALFALNSKLDVIIVIFYILFVDLEDSVIRFRQFIEEFIDIRG